MLRAEIVKRPTSPSTRPAAAIAGRSAASSSARLPLASTMAAASRPSGSSCPPIRRLNGALNGRGSRPHRAESNERGDLDDERRSDRDAVGPSEPCDAAVAGDQNDDRGRGSHVDRSCERAELRMRQRQRFRQRMPDRQLAQRLLRILQGLAGGGDEHQERGTRQQHAEQMAHPLGRGQMRGDAGQRRVDPGVDVRLRHEQDERERQQRRSGE